MANHMDVDIAAPPSSTNATKDNVESAVGKKRKSAEPAITSDIENVNRKDAKKRDTGQGKMCHQCHQKRESFLRCTLSKTKKGKKTERCGITFCDTCLSRRYDQNARAIAAAGRPKDMMKLLGHVQTEDYVWKCPVCSQDCNCSTHRKKSGLPPTGSLGTYAKENGVTIQQLLQDPIALSAAQAMKEKTRKSSTPDTKEGTAWTAVNSVNGTAQQSNVAVKEKSKKTAKENGVSNGDVEKKAEKAPKAPKAKKSNETTEAGGKKQKKMDKPKKEKKVAATTGVKEGKNPSKITILPPISSTEATENNVKYPVMRVPLPPKPFVKRPKMVADPEFEFIAISHPLSVIDARLRIREFVLRFEKILKMPSKYVHIINDPNSDWTTLTYKNLITCLLILIQSDANPTIHPDVVYEGVAEIRKTSADDTRLWEIFRNIMETVFHVDHIEDLENEETRLEMLNMLIDSALGTSTFRQRMEQDSLKEKEVHQETVKKIKDYRAQWDEEKQTFQKERLLLNASERGDLEERYKKAFDGHKKLVALAEQREWFTSRKLDTRNSPLGVDSKGNVYYQFIQRDKQDEDWGQWVVIKKNPDLPHPSGVLPKQPEMSSSPGDENDSLPDLPQPESEDVVRERIWYAVSGASEVKHLADWIQYQADLVWYNKAMAEQPPAPTHIPALAFESASGEVSPFFRDSTTPSKSKKQIFHQGLPQSPSRQVMTCVQVPLRTPAKTPPVDTNIPPEELMTKDSIKELVSELRKISGFMALSENGVDHLVK